MHFTVLKLCYNVFKQQNEYMAGNRKFEIKKDKIFYLEIGCLAFKNSFQLKRMYVEENSYICIT